MATRTPPPHWLARIVGREMEIPASARLDEVWTRVAEDSGFSDSGLALKVAGHFHLAVADLSQIEQSAFDLIPEKLARHFQVIGLREKPNRITVASSDPANLRVEQIIAFATGRRVIFEVAAPSQLRRIIESMYAPEYVAENLLARARTELADAVRFVARGAEPEVISLEEAGKTPVVRLTNLILHDAIQGGASDIHIEPDLKDGIVRTRVDGVLQNYMQVPRAVLDRVVSRIKIMGSMDISDRLRPQGGRAHVQVGGIDYDLRISTVPTRQSEKAVIRILGPGRVHSLEGVGVPEVELRRLRQLFSNRDGVLVVTGPTGSGKTTTLYAAIQELATGKINIMTVEDPVEYELSGITQIQVAPRQGLTFAAALRTVLRQDLDIILVGEIRDLETAEIAVQASMTGHLVLTTLHTNDAVSVLDRLAGLGISRMNMASALRGVVAQRLLRHLCFDCREKVQKMTQEEEQFPSGWA